MVSQATRLCSRRQRTSGVYSLAEPALVIHGRSNDGMTIGLQRPVVSLGSLPDNDVVVNEPGVSPRHAEVARTETGFYLRDLGSAGGTFVNMHDIGNTQHLLRDGDRIRLDDSSSFIVFRAGTGAVKRPDNRVDDSLHAREVATPPEVPAGSPSDEVYEETVRLTVDAEGYFHQMINFVAELRNMPQLRLLGNSHSAEILLGMREPLPLRQVLGQIQGVAQVSVPEEMTPAPTGDHRALAVRIAE